MVFWWLNFDDDSLRDKINFAMRALLQRVKSAKVSIGGEKISEIGKGLLILFGVRQGDEEKDSLILAEKIANLRVMSDENDKMNLSIRDVNGQILVVSQFTLYGDTTFGRRPSFVKAAKPELAKNLYELFVQQLKDFGIPVKTGKFGEYMAVELINDGPVTLMVET